MNLGAFMNPEYPIFSTTLCYLERDDAYLMLHRVKKEDDYNHDKWVGVGGKFERFESPEDCLLREVKEETGLTLTHWRSRGLLTFIWGNMTEFIHLYTADGRLFLYAQFSFRSPSLIQPSLRSISQKRTLSTAGRTKQMRTRAAQSIGVMAALVPAAMSLTQPV